MKTQEQRDVLNSKRRLAARLNRRHAAAEAMQRRHAAALAASQARLAILTEEEREILRLAEAVQAKLAAYDATRQQGTLAVLELTLRTAKALAAAGIQEVSDLATMTDLEILKLPNMGKKSLREIRDALARM